MIALVLAAAAAISAPQTPEAACEDHDLQGMVSAPKEQSPLHRQEVDRRLALVLSVERSALAEAAARQPARELAIPGGLALAALLAGLAAGGRRRGLAALAVVCALGAGGLALRARERVLASSARVADLRDCRLKLLETRSTLEHGELARCIGDLSEVDEDLMGYESKLKSNRQVTLQEVQKLRGEIAHR